MAQLLPPVPKEPIEPDSRIWREWFNKVRNVIVGTAQGVISWASLNFDGSNITDIVTRNHNDLQTIQGGTANQYYHLTATQLTNLGTVTTVSVATSNGFAGTVATATSTPVITLKTSVTGLLKGNGTAISAATSGTDYAPATSGTSILYGNGSGGFSNVTIGTGVSFTTGTLSATGSGGTITSVTGTAPVASSGGTTPVISMAAATTSVNGYLTSTDWTTFNNKGSGTVTSVAAITLGTTGTDLSSTVANGTTTPVITLQVPTASASNRGALSAADWTTFNSKGSGTVTSVTGSAPVVSSGGTTPAISMAAATTSVSGYLTSTDWTTFNNKGSGTVTSVSGTAGRVSSTGGTTPVIDLVSGIASAGTTGSASLIPVVTIDTYGRVTSITTAANPQGTVTSVGGTGTINGITLTGTVTSSGNLTLGGTLSGVSLTTQVSGTLPTANGGTNLTSFTSGGVVYASSASVLATGSSLVFDGTNLGIGTASPGSKLHIAQSAPAATGPILFLHNTAATQAGAVGNLARITFGLDNGATAPGGNAYILAQEDGYSSYATSIQFGLSDGTAGPAERMRLTSTGLAITGALSATGKASFTGGTVSSVVNPAVAIDYQRVLRFNDSSNTSWAGYIVSSGTALGIGGNGSVVFDVGGATYATLTSSGLTVTGYQLTNTGLFNNVGTAQTITIADGNGGYVVITGIQPGIGSSTSTVPFVKRGGSIAVGTASKAILTADPIASITASAGDISVTPLAANTYITYAIHYTSLGA